MKKILALVLVVMSIMSMPSLHALAETDDTQDVWTNINVLDADGQPTGEVSIINTAFFDGTFDNGSTSNAWMITTMITNKDSVNFEIYERGLLKVSNQRDRERTFDVVVTDESGTLYQYCGIMKTDCISVTGEEKIELIRLMQKNKKLNFCIKDHADSSVFYNFTIEDIGNYNEALVCLYDQQFRKALALMENDNYEEAYDMLYEIRDYKEASELLQNNEDLLFQAEIKPFTMVNNIVTYGHYEQDNNLENGAEPIEWIVLEYNEKNNQVLLISRYGLDAKKYNASLFYVAWKNSNVHDWLNKEFLEAAFSEKEQSRIVTVSITTPRDNGGSTNDKIWLLSEEEAKSYFRGDAERMAELTEYAIANGARKYDRKDGTSYCQWWVRTPAHDLVYYTEPAMYPQTVSGSGSFTDTHPNDSGCAVRPVFWLNLEPDRKQYDQAKALQEEKKYDEAIKAYEALFGYADSEAQIEICKEAIKEEKYQRAAELRAAGMYDEAYALLNEIKDYKDVEELLNTDADFMNSEITALMAFTKVNNIVTFGCYEQDGDIDNGKEPIEWIVLEYDMEKDRSLLLSKYGLDMYCFQRRKVSGIDEDYAGWDESDIRTWLNEEFINEAFTLEEQNQIEETITHTEDNKLWISYYKRNNWSRFDKIKGGKDCGDKVFLLSLEELLKYAGYSDIRIEDTEQGQYLLKITPTKYVLQKYKNQNERYWWLRSPSGRTWDASAISTTGYISEINISYEEIVRPAFWLKFDEVDLFYQRAKEQYLEEKYRAARALQEEERYDEAILAYEELNGYFDSTEQVDVCDKAISEKNEKSYQTAKKLFDSEKYWEAYKIFAGLKGYKDVDELLRTDIYLLAVAEENELFMTVNGEVVYGNYEQDGNKENGKEPIEWIVLDFDEENDRALLISKYGLGSRKFNSSYEYSSWEKSNIRAWLNKDFLDAAFTDEEQTRIQTVCISTPSYAGISGGNDTEDKIWLLSREEVMSYYTKINDRKAIPTEYAVQQGGSADCAEWWLRSPGINYGSVSTVSKSGYIGNNNGANYYSIVVRPVFWLKLNTNNKVFKEKAMHLEEVKDSNNENYDNEVQTEALENEVSEIENQMQNALTVNNEQFMLVNNVVTYGSYNQNGREREPIEWIVLEYDGENNRALLLSMYGLEVKEFYSGISYPTWENSSIREWLNSRFINAAFTEKEKGRIVEVTVHTDSNEKWEAVAKKNGWTYGYVPAGSDCKDKIFLLSMEEAMKYAKYENVSEFLNGNNNLMKMQLTAAADSDQYMAFYYYLVYSECWWLRSPGASDMAATYVHKDGSLGYGQVYHSVAAVRPAFWIDLND